MEGGMERLYQFFAFHFFLEPIFLLLNDNRPDPLSSLAVLKKYITIYPARHEP